MDTDLTTLHTAPVGPGWRELLELMHSEIEDMRSALAASAEREAALVRIIEAERDTGREGRLLDLLVNARQEIDRLRAELQASRPPHAPLDATPRPAPPRARSPLHTAIVQLLAHHPDGLSAGAIATVLHTKPLSDTMQGLARRGHVVRRGPGVYGLPVGTLEPVGLNGVGMGP